MMLKGIQCQMSVGTLEVENISNVGRIHLLSLGMKLRMHKYE